MRRLAGTATYGVIDTLIPLCVGCRISKYDAFVESLYKIFLEVQMKGNVQVRLQYIYIYIYFLHFVCIMCRLLAWGFIAQIT